MGLMGQGVFKMECHDETKPALVSHYRSLDPCNCFNPWGLVGRPNRFGGKDLSRMQVAISK